MSSVTKNVGYQPFVDGLRAVSILGVIGHHLELDFLPGGFVGVDVFFVISGYLIIAQLMSAIASGTLDVGDFWARRVLRILPPYFLVIACAAVAAPFVLATEAQRGDFFASMRWSALMAANHYFLGEQGYFDTEAASKPLLHLWSLGVEEQFYFVVPVVLLAWWGTKKFAFRSRVGRFLWIVFPGCLAVLSWIGCVRYTGGGDAKNWAFYLMPLRAWEFVAGGAVSAMVSHLHSVPRAVASAMCGLGLGLVVASMLALDEESFPSFWATLPVVGASMALLFSRVVPDSLAVRLLGSTGFVGIGLISYGWYLWHWPLLTFVRIWNLGEANLGLDGLAAFVSLWLAVGTYFFVERPIRSWRRKRKDLLAWPLALCGVVASLLVAGVTFAWSGEQARARTPSEETDGGDDSEAEEEDDSETGNGIDPRCDFRLLAHPMSECMDALQGRSLAIVVGDSHGSRYFRYLMDALGDEKVLLTRTTYAGCSPLPDVLPKKKKDPEGIRKCSYQKDMLFGAIARGEVKPDSIILVAFWGAYLNGHRTLTLADDERGLEPSEIFSEKLSQLLDLLERAGVPRVLVIGPGPVFPKSVPECVAQARTRGLDVDVACGKRRGISDLPMELIAEQAARRSFVRGIDSLKVLCEGGTCRTTEEGEPLYSDKHHLKYSAMRRVHRAYRDDFDWVFGVQVSPLTSRQERY